MDVDREDVRTMIREAGLRATPGRVGVYLALLEASQPLTHADLVEQVAFLGLDKATVYRNLFDLSEVGLLRRTDLGDHTWRFEIATQDDAHPHFVCVECGDIQCLTGVELSVKRGKKLPRSLKSKEVELQVRGVCDECS